MDAPPTGRITRFLNVNDEVAGLARIGPIHNQAQAVMRVLKSPRDGGPPGDAAGGDAGPGDRGRHRRAARRRAAGGRGHRQHGAAATLLDEDDAANSPRAAAATAVAKALSAAGLGGARRGGLAERLVDPLLDAGRGARRAGATWSASSAPCSASSACRCTNCRCSARAWTWRACTSWPTELRKQGMGT